MKPLKFLFTFSFILGLIFIGLSGCNQSNFPGKKKDDIKTLTPAFKVKGTIIAKVNNIPITLEDLNEEVEAFNAMIPGDRPDLKITTREQRIKYLKDEMIRRLYLYQYALDKRMDEKEEIQRAMEKTKQLLLVNEVLAEEAEKIKVSHQEIEKYYDDYKEELKVPEERRIREILVYTESEAKEIMIQLLQGADFATLARQKSKSASAKQGGDLGFIEPGKRSAEFESVAFQDTLEVGNISNYFKGEGGYYILKLEAKQGGQQKSLPEMWDEIERAVKFIKHQARIEELVGKISTEAKVEIYEGEIK